MMKQLTTSILTICLLLGLLPISGLLAQPTDPASVNCGSADAMQHLFNAHPDQLKEWKEFNKNVHYPSSRNTGNCDKHYVIPVVFHVFHNGGSSSVTPAQVQSGLNKVNEDFNALNGDYNTVDPAFQDIRGSLNITFALATIDPDGNPTTGIMYYPAQSGFGNGSGYDDEIISYAWDNYKYMNVYIMRDLYDDGDHQNSGVAWYPSTWMSDNNLARVVYNDWYLGNTGTSVASGEFQSVLTHEFGHWLNLAHTFDQGCSGTGDGVLDTPTTQGEAGCGPNAMSCGHITNGENYMDYNSSCYKMYSQGQIDRMVAALEGHSTRRPLWQLENLEATGTIQHYQYNTPIADFEASQIFVNVGQTVFFTDQSCGFPTEWEWTINGGEPSSSSDQNPSSQFNEPGTYEVSLVVSNANGESEVFTITIYVDVDPLDCQTGYTFEEEETGALPISWTNISLDGLYWVIEEDVFHNYQEVVPFTSNGHSSIKSLYCPENWIGDGPVEVILSSPSLDFSDMEAPTLSYWTLRGWDNLWPEPKPEHEIEILAGTSAFGPWTNIGTDLIMESQFHDWVEVTNIDLSAFAGEDEVYVAFRSDTHHYYWRIDDFCIQDAFSTNTNDLDQITDFKAYLHDDILKTNSSSFDIYSITGQSILNHKGSTEVGVGHLSSGLYFVVNTDKRTFKQNVRKVFIP
ncbi:MAG: PKD domain-containing protein [Chitinophagales bacterium]|nr:PKD domain-containing protein [Chitinophagales bacterium]